LLQSAAASLKVPTSELGSKLEQLIDANKVLEKELAKLKSKLALSQGDDLAGSATEVAGIQVLAAALDGADVKILRETLDKLRDKLKTAAIVLATIEGGKVSLIAGVTADATNRIKAGELVNFVALQVGGKGGGRADMAQAGGTNPAGLPAALASVVDWVKKNLT
jgi:alanyl-tRNA synthetase